MRTLVVVIAELLICALASFGAATLLTWFIEGRSSRQPTRIRAESIEITGPGGQIVIHCHDKPTIRVIDAQKVGGIDRSSENILAEGK